MGRNYGRTWTGSGGHIEECGFDNIHIRTGMWKHGEGDTGHLRSGPIAHSCILSGGDWATNHVPVIYSTMHLGVRAKLDPAVWAPIERSFVGEHNGSISAKWALGEVRGHEQTSCNR